MLAFEESWPCATVGRVASFGESGNECIDRGWIAYTYYIYTES